MPTCARSGWRSDCPTGRRPRGCRPPGISAPIRHSLSGRTDRAAESPPRDRSALVAVGQAEEIPQGRWILAVSPSEGGAEAAAPGDARFRLQVKRSVERMSHPLGSEGMRSGGFDLRTLTSSRSCRCSRASANARSRHRSGCPSSLTLLALREINAGDSRGASPRANSQWEWSISRRESWKASTSRGRAGPRLMTSLRCDRPSSAMSPRGGSEKSLSQRRGEPPSSRLLCKGVATISRKARPPFALASASH